MPTLEWRASDKIRTYLDASGRVRPLKEQVYTSSPFEKFVRTLCREEIEEAKKRLCISQGIYSYKPSERYLKEKKKLYGNKNNKQNKKPS